MRAQPGGRSRRGVFVTLVFCSAVAALPAHAEKYVGAGAGALVPYSGMTGWTVVGEIGTDWTNEYVRVGGEFVFGDLKRTADLRPIGGGQVEVGMRTYELRFVTRYVMFPDKISPYIGVGGGFIVVDLDDASLRRATNNVAFLPASGGVGFGGGVDGQVGLEIPLFSKELNLFFEGRVKYNWEFTDNLEPIAGPDNFGGFSGIGGVRARF